MLDFQLVHFAEIESTNIEAARLDYPHNTILIAEHQTAGRGQRGNSWKSNPGENLTFSLVIYPENIPANQQYHISMMAALAASDAIRSAGVNCMIKWSNDLYVGDKKIGGILIEHSLKNNLVRKSIIGIGINVLQRLFDPSLPNPTSITAEGVVDCTPNQLLEYFMDSFKLRYAQSPESLYSDYMERLWRKEGVHKFSDSYGEFSARIAYVNPQTGRLTLKDELENDREYWFQEVKFVL